MKAVCQIMDDMHTKKGAEEVSKKGTKKALIAALTQEKIQLKNQLDLSINMTSSVTMRRVKPDKANNKELRKMMTNQVMNARSEIMA